MMKKVLAVIMAAALLFALALPASAKEFSDVQEGDWYYGAVNRWSDLGVINGYEDGSFKPGNPIKRSEFAKILVTVFKAPESTVNPFTDVDVSKWDGPYVLSAYAAGWMNGETATKFNRNGYLTREAGFAVFRRALGIPALSAAEADEVLAAFSDGSKTDDWAKGEVAALVKAGYVSGDGKTLKPLDYLTRAELVVLLDKLTGNTYNNTTRAYDDNKLYITEEGDYEVKDPNFIVIIATKDPVTLKGDANRVIVAPGAEGGQLNLEDGNFGDVVVQAEKYAVASQPGSTVENVVNEDGKNVTLTFTVSFDWNIKDDPKSEIAYVKDGEKVGSERIFPTTRDGYTFDGWFTTEEKVDGEIAFDFDTAIDQSYTLYAHWTEDSTPVEPTPSEGEYKVTFDADGGSAVETQIVKEGEKAKKPADPTKEGYEFKGWFAGETEYDFTAAVTADVALKAKWNIISYTVTFDADGGEVAKKTVTQAYNTTIDEEPEATKIGFYLDGWYDGETKVTFPYTIKGNVTLKAKWNEEKTYVVLYEEATGVTYKGAVNKTLYERVKESEGLTLLKVAEVNVEGLKVLTGWEVRSAEAEVGSGTVYKPGEKVAITGNVLVTPVLSAGYEVDFYLTDDIWEDAADEVDAYKDAYKTVRVADGMAVEAPEVERIGYTFQYWAVPTQNETTDEWEYAEFDIDTPITEALTNVNTARVSLVAVWAADDLTLHLYDDAYTAAHQANAGGTSKYIYGLASSVDAVKADEVNEIELTYDGKITHLGFTPDDTAGTGNATSAAPAVFVEVPELPTGWAVETYVKIGVAEANLEATVAAGIIDAGNKKDTTTNADELNIYAAKAADDVKGIKVAVTAADTYTLVQFKYTKGAADSDTSPIYVLKVNEPAAADLVTVNVNLGLTLDKLMDGTTELVKDVDYLEEYTIVVPKGTEVDSNKAANFVQTQNNGDVTKAFTGMTVIGGLNKPVEPVDGVYTLTANSKVTFQWEAAIPVIFDPDESADGYNAATPLMAPTGTKAGEKYVLPESEFEPAEGYVFAGWDVTFTGAEGSNKTGLPVGYEINVPAAATKVTLTATYTEGHKVTLSAGFGDDPMTEDEENETIEIDFVGEDGNSYNVPNTAEEAGLTPREGYKFAGWYGTFESENKTYAITDTTKTNELDEAGVAALTLLAPNTKLTNAQIKTNPVLTAYWIPEVEFASVDKTYVGKLGSETQQLSAATVKTLSELVFTPDEEEDDTFVLTTKDGSALAYGANKAGTAAGFYAAFQVAFPEDVDVTELTYAGTNLAPNDALAYDTVGEYNNKNGNVTLFLKTAPTLDPASATLTFTYAHGKTRTYTLDLSELTYGYPVTFFYDIEDVDDDVVTFAYKDELSVPDEVTAKLEKTGYTFEEWSYGETAYNGDGSLNTAGCTNYINELAVPKVEGPITMVAHWTANEYDLTVTLDGGAVQTAYDTAVTTHNGDENEAVDYVVKFYENDKAAHDDVILLPKNTQESKQIVKPGNVLQYWLVNGTKVLGGNTVTITGDTTIEAVWASSLAAIDVAPLSADPKVNTALVDAASYKAGYINEDGEFAEFDETVDNTGKVSDGGTVIEVAVQAQNLAVHKNETVYGADDEAHWIGVSLTPPTALGVTGYVVGAAADTLNVANAKNLNTSKAAVVYLPLKDDGSLESDTFKIDWVKSDALLGDPITYKIIPVVTYAIDEYTVKYGGGSIAGGADYEADASSGLLTQDHLKANRSIDAIVLKPTADNFWDKELVDALAASEEMPEGFKAEVVYGDDGTSTSLKITGKTPTTGALTNEIEIPDFGNCVAGKFDNVKPDREEVTFEAKTDTTGVVTNLTDDVMAVTVKTGGTEGDPVKLPANGTVTLSALAKDKVITVYRPQTYDTKVSEGFEVATVGQQTKPADLGKVDAPLVADDSFGFIKGFNPELSYEVKIGDSGTWAAATVNEDGVFKPAKAGDYYFRVAAAGDKLASAATENAVTIDDAPTAGASVTITFQDAEGTELFQLTTDNNGQFGAEALQKLTESKVTKWEIVLDSSDHTGVFVAIDGNTKFASNTNYTLVAAED